ncbi:MAG: hypothetical protein WCT24_00785 [Patescibacteria group bacterium]|jgi:hypothetical protein
MNRKSPLIYAALAGMIMGIAAMAMYLTAAISGAMVFMVYVVLNGVFGPGWAGGPVSFLAPLAIVYLIYCGSIATVFIYYMIKHRDEPNVQVFF